MELTGFIKAVAFSSNSWALAALAGGGSPTLETLCIASCFSGMFTILIQFESVIETDFIDALTHSIRHLHSRSMSISDFHFFLHKIAGFVTSFLVNPIERIKILMQSDKSGVYKSEIDCAIKVISEDGLKGLLVRGLDATLAREIPGYGLYFVAYSLLMQSSIGLALGPTFSPLVCGAAAGCLSWIPVFPFDVIKTYEAHSVCVVTMKRPSTVLSLVMYCAP